MCELDDLVECAICAACCYCCLNLCKGGDSSRNQNNGPPVVIQNQPHPGGPGGPMYYGSVPGQAMPYGQPQQGYPPPPGAYYPPQQHGFQPGFPPGPGGPGGPIQNQPYPQQYPPQYPPQYPAQQQQQFQGQGPPGYPPPYPASQYPMQQAYNPDAPKF